MLRLACEMYGNLHGMLRLACEKYGNALSSTGLIPIPGSWMPQVFFPGMGVGPGFSLSSAAFGLSTDPESLKARRIKISVNLQCILRVADLG